MKSLLLLFISSAFMTPTFLRASDDDWTKSRVERRVSARYEIDLRVSKSEDRHYWYTSPPALPYQKILQAPTFSIPPTHSFQDGKFGNSIRYWNFSGNERFHLEMHWQLSVQNTLNSITPGLVSPFDPTSEEYQLYTKSDRLTHINSSVLQIKAQIEQLLAGERNAAIIARAAYFWVLDHMAYSTLDRLDRDRGTDALLNHPFQHGSLTYFKGDCGEYTLLYNAILRSFGIPARTVTGGWSIGKNQWHVWSEVLLPGYGWVPVDTSAADVYVYDEGKDLNQLGDKELGAEFFRFVQRADFYFGSLDPYRFVMSVGNDIPLEPVLPWDFSDDKRSWFYQDGAAGYIQLGLFHAGAELDRLGIEFGELP